MTEEAERFIWMAMPDDPLILLALGKVAVRHAQLERVIRFARRSFTNETAAEALRVTSRWPLSQVCRELRKAAVTATNAKIPSVRLLCWVDAAALASDKRNELFHGVWGQELDADLVLSKRDNPFSPAPTAAMIESLAEELGQLARDIGAEPFAYGNLRPDS